MHTVLGSEDTAVLVIIGPAFEEDDGESGRAMVDGEVGLRFKQLG
jgi:hypothetical protein